MKGRMGIDSIMVSISHNNNTITTTTIIKIKIINIKEEVKITVEITTNKINIMVAIIPTEITIDTIMSPKTYILMTPGPCETDIKSN